MKHNDLYLCLLVAFCALAGFWLNHMTTENLYVQLSKNGIPIQKVPLADLPRQTIIPTEHGQILLEKTKNGIQVSQSPCPDQFCVQQGIIAQSGSVIVCLPEQVLIELLSLEQKGGAPDAVLH